MRVRRDHWGAGFELWTGGQSWFWYLRDPCRAGGAIGAAATEADAVREARAAIEEMSAEPCEDKSAARRPAGWCVGSIVAREMREARACRLDCAAECPANA